MPEPGYCQCGCGDLAPIAKLTRRGYRKGEPMRFIQGHHLRLPEYKDNLYTPERNAKISAAHAAGRIPYVTYPSGADHPSWRGENISYSRAHARIIAERGPAPSHQCAECGSAAHEWAFNHAHKPTRVVVHDGRPTPLSVDVNAYEPLCRSCHRLADSRGGYRA